MEPIININVRLIISISFCLGPPLSTPIIYCATNSNNHRDSTRDDAPVVIDSILSLATSKLFEIHIINITTDCLADT